MKPLFLRDPEAAVWKIGVNVIERKTNPQPQKISDGFQYTCIQGEIYAQENAPVRFPDFGPEIVPAGIVCPYHPGDKVAVKETWRFVDVNAAIPEGRFIDVQYKAGYGVSGWEKDWRNIYEPKQ